MDYSQKSSNVFLLSNNSGIVMLIASQCRFSINVFQVKRILL
jgi:hypothetical protein